MEYYDKTKDGKSFELPVKLYTQAAAGIVKAAILASYEAYCAEAGKQYPAAYKCFEPECLREADGHLVLTDNKKRYIRDYSFRHAVTTMGGVIRSGIEHMLRKAYCWAATQKARRLLPNKEFTYGGFTAYQAFCLYELLQHKKPANVMKAYGEDAYKTLVGQPDNILAVTRRKTITDTIEALNVKFNQECNDLNKARLEDPRIKAIYAEYDEKRKALSEAHDAKIEELKVELYRLRSATV